MDAPQTLPIGAAVVAFLGPLTDSVTGAAITDGTHAWRLLDSAGAVVTSGAVVGSGAGALGAGNVYRGTIPGAVTALCTNGSLYFVEQTLTRSGLVVDARRQPLTARYRGAA